MSAPPRQPLRPPLTRTERLAATYAARSSPARTDYTAGRPLPAPPAAPSGALPGIDAPWRVAGTLAIDKPLAQPRYVPCRKEPTFLP